MKLNFIYYGQSKELSERAKRFCQKVKIEENVTFFLFDNFDISFLYSVEDQINLILFDYPSNHPQFNIAIDFLQTIRKTAISRNYYFCITSEDEKAIHQQNHFFRSGINSIFNKDGDIELFYYQLFYIADNDLYIPRYATTKKFYAKSMISIPLYFELFSEQQITIASDFRLSQEFEFSRFLEKYKIKANKKNEKEFSQTSFTRFCTDLEPEFPNAWENDTKNSFDSIATSVRLKLEGSITKDNILFITQYERFLDLCKTNPELSIKNNITCLQINPNDIINKKLYGKFDLIIIDDQTQISEDQKYDLIFEITSYNKANYGDLLPLLVILKSNSTSEALSKVLKYPKLMASETTFSNETIIKLITALNKKEKVTQEGIFNFPSSARASLNFMDLDVVVTALNEFRITFITETEIPLYSFVQIDLGIILNILIVPPTMYMAKVGDKTHYMGFFFGMSEKTLQKLRILVNHFLNIQVNELDDTFFDLITDDMKKLEPPKEEEVAEEKIIENKEIVQKTKPKKVEEVQTSFKKGYYSKM